MTKKPIEYFRKFQKDIAERGVIIVDPMLATGGSAIEAINIIKSVTDQQIYLVNILDAPEGIKAVQEAHPDVKLYTVEVDEKLNDNAYISCRVSAMPATACSVPNDPAELKLPSFKK